jgi:hypothetical protein
MAAFAFIEALEARDWAALIPESEILASETAEGRRWINPSVVLDSGVLARIFQGEPEAARDFYLRLEPLSGRRPEEFRSRLIRAHLDRALSLR